MENNSQNNITYINEKEVDTVIKVTLTNEILKRISEIDKNRFSFSTIEMPPITKNRLRKNSIQRGGRCSIRWRKR